jgi:protein O-GlcNAc transferase
MLLRKFISGLFNVPRNTHSAAATLEPGVDGLRFNAALTEADRLAAAGELTHAVERYQACIQAAQASADAWLRMGNVLLDMWRVEDAVSAYRRALELEPGSFAVHSAVLFHNHYLVPVDARRLFELHRISAAVMRTAVPRARESYVGTPDPGRRLRIGYVSPNLSAHSVGYFAEPVIVHHDRRQFDVHCYYAHRLSDATTQRIRSASDAWHNIFGKSDADVAHRIRGDGIDILIDLAGHSKGNRLGVFARKPAPLQMTWLGYPDTTGLDTVDYRITDHIADPAPHAESLHTERLLRTDGIFLSYLPPADSPPVSRRASAGPDVVFCCFNSIAKLNDETIRLWCRILTALPQARLVMKSAPLQYTETADRIVDAFVRHGVTAGRITLHGWIARRNSHLDLYSETDIALDTCPYNGTTTTCEALWMGVPVVSLAGHVSMSRVGAALLHSVGLGELVAENADQYVEIALALARDAARRVALRTELRQRMRNSPLLDHKNFTLGLERAYRRCWAAWCERQNIA